MPKQIDIVDPTTIQPISGTVTANSVVFSAIQTGRKSGIGLTALQLLNSSVPLTRGATVKAAYRNTAYLSVGASTVTHDTSDSTDGIELGPGDSHFFPVDNINKLYAIASATGQEVTFEYN